MSQTVKPRPGLDRVQAFGWFSLAAGFGIGAVTDRWRALLWLGAGLSLIPIVVPSAMKRVRRGRVTILPNDLIQTVTWEGSSDNLGGRQLYRATSRMFVTNELGKQLRILKAGLVKPKKDGVIKPYWPLGNMPGPVPTEFELSGVLEDGETGEFLLETWLAADENDDGGFTWPPRLRTRIYLVDQYGTTYKTKRITFHP